jgi:hypothetical protein
VVIVEVVGYFEFGITSGEGGILSSLLIPTDKVLESLACPGSKGRE